MPVIRSLMMFIVVLLLALGPGQHAHAAGVSPDIGAVIATHQDAGGCASAMALQGKAEKHDGNCAKMTCCLGAMCVFAGLPMATAFATPLIASALPLSAVTAALTGRNVAPPLDPPRSFA